VVENKEFKDMVTFIRPETQIPSANTVRRDLATNFKNVKKSFKKNYK
jgi:hypothetical protein